MGLKIMSWNCQSIRNKIPELVRFIDKYAIDIILLSETWLSENVNFFIPLYDCYRADRYHGGTAVLIKNSISHSFSHLISFDYAEATFIKVNDRNNETLIGAIYCSPAASRTQSQTFFSKVLSNPGCCLISGDFNAKNIRWNSDKVCRKGLDLCKLADSRLFTIHGPDNPTLIPPRGKPSVVDFVLSKATHGVSDPQTINELSSDHLPLTFHFPFNSVVPNDYSIFNYAKADWKNFQTIIQSSIPDLKNHFSSLDNETSINTCIQSVNRIIMTATENSIPKKLPYRLRYPYSQEIHILTKHRNFYRRKFKETHDSAFRSASNQLTKLIKSRTALLHQSNYDDKIAKLDPTDNTLFRFAKCLKNKKSFLPPLKTLTVRNLIQT
jgi:endonuclease/exonuclease/phosphatase family metal-dependent hydrolase